MVRGGDGQQQRWWRMIPFTSLTILPFDKVLVNFNRWNRKRSENNEDWALRDVFWLRIERDMKV